MDYSHDFASAIWKKPVEKRELYAGLIIGLTEGANGDDGRISPCEDLQAVLQGHRSMFSSSRNDSFTTDPMFKKNEPKTSGRPREKRKSRSDRKSKVDESKQQSKER